MSDATVTVHLHFPRTVLIERVETTYIGGLPTLDAVAERFMDLMDGAEWATFGTSVFRTDALLALEVVDIESKP